jgi:hypothetical protein
MPRLPGQRSDLHAPRQSAGYARGAVIGPGDINRYRPAEAPGSRPACDRCKCPGADHLCPKSDDPTFERPGYRFCQPCAYAYSEWRREKGLLP